MEWTVTIEGRDELGELQRAQLRIGKEFKRLTSGEIGLSIDDGKRIMTMLQELVVKQELAAYAFARRVCPRTRALSTRQGLNDAENPDSVRNRRGQVPAMDALPALPSPHVHGVHGS